MFQIFSGTGIKIPSDGRRHLGGLIGTNENKNKCIDQKNGEWCKEISFVNYCSNRTLCSLCCIYLWFKTSLYLFYEDNSKYFTKFKTTGKKDQELFYQIPIQWL